MLPWLQLPPWDRCFIASTAGEEIFSFHTPDTFILFFFAENFCFDKGKNLQDPMGPRTPWPWAARCPRLPAACYTGKELSPCYSPVLTGTSHLLTWCPPVQHTPCAPRSLCRRGRVSDCAAHTCGQGHVPLWCCAGSPCGCPHVLQLVGTVHSPVPGLPASSIWAKGQQERPPQSSGPSMLYLQLAVGKQV